MSIPTRRNPRHAPQRPYKNARVEAIEKRFGKPLRAALIQLHLKLGSQKAVAEHLGYSQGGLSTMYKRCRPPIEVKRLPSRTTIQE